MYEQTVWLTISEMVINDRKYAVKLNVPVAIAPTAEHDLPIPMPNDYVGLAQWLRAEKEQGRDWYGQCNFNRSEMARRLSERLGWVVDVNALRRAQCRQERKLGRMTE